MNNTEEKIIIVEEFGCAVKISHNELYYTPLLENNTYEDDFTLITEPANQAFLNIVNKEF